MVTVGKNGFSLISYYYLEFSGSLLPLRILLNFPNFFLAYDSGPPAVVSRDEIRTMLVLSWEPRLFTALDP